MRRVITTKRSSIATEERGLGEGHEDERIVAATTTVWPSSRARELSVHVASPFNGSGSKEHRNRDEDQEKHSGISSVCQQDEFEFSAGAFRYYQQNAF